MRSVLLILTVSTPAIAQEPGTRTPVPEKHAVTVNPVLTVIGWFNAEYERKINQAATWAVSTSFFDIDKIDYRAFSAHLRFYPERASLTGVFMGAKAGIHHVAEHYRDIEGDQTGTIGSFGVELGYTWITGKDRRFVFSVGGGADRLLGGDGLAVQTVVPTIRAINVGFAF